MSMQSHDRAPGDDAAFAPDRHAGHGRIARHLASLNANMMPPGDLMNLQAQH